MSGSGEAPLISVVVPVYNGALYLRESLDSILAQTHRPLEVLVLDDASTDDTPAVAAAYGEAVRYHRQRANQGIYANVNTGLGLARGDYVAVYHADDVYEPVIVERELDFFRRHPETGAVFCLDVFIDAEGREYGRLALPPEIPGGRPLSFATVLNGLLLYKNAFLVSPSPLVRADVYRTVGPYRPELFLNNADLDMWVRIARRYPIAVLPEHLMRYRHFHGHSAQRDRYLRSRPARHFPIMDLHLAEGGRALASPSALAAHEAHRSEDHLMIAIARYITGDLAGARAALREARIERLAASPRVQRGRLILLLVLFRALGRLPRSALVARAAYGRWHARRAPGGSSSGGWLARRWAPPSPPG